MLKDIEKAVEAMRKLSREELDLANAEVVAKRRGRAGGRKSAAKRSAAKRAWATRRARAGKAAKASAPKAAAKRAASSGSANGKAKAVKPKPSLTERLTGRADTGGRPTVAAAQDE
jgi:hypothetical protein